jgi:hypothetical protein
MLIDRQFNTFTYDEYFHHIKNHKDYDDFNTLGLYRSIVENENIDMEQKIAVRDFSHIYFEKFFEFLQVKDPHIYITISTLGEDLNKPNLDQLWTDIRANQQRILSDKKIKHRSFGVYSKHIDCGWDNCFCNGMMVRPYWRALVTEEMRFKTDKGSYRQKAKSLKQQNEGRKIRNTLLQKPIED